MDFVSLMRVPYPMSLLVTVSLLCGVEDRHLTIINSARVRVSPRRGRRCKNKGGMSIVHTSRYLDNPYTSSAFGYCTLFRSFPSLRACWPGKYGLLLCAPPASLSRSRFIECPNTEGGCLARACELNKPSNPRPASRSSRLVTDISSYAGLNQRFQTKRHERHAL